MSDELEALVGYVFVVGGRAVSATPPGAWVALPPRKVGRSREGDTFFTLIIPAGAAGGAALYEELARLAADVYFRSSGGVTSGLRDAIAAVDDHLSEAGQRQLMSMVSLVLRGSEVYSARIGACMCLLRQGDQLQIYPDDLRELSGPGISRLGGGAALDVRLSRYEIAPGDVMVIADGGLAPAGHDRLDDALSGKTIPDIIEALKGTGSRDTQAMVIQFVSAGTPNPTPPPSTRMSRPAGASTPIPSRGSQPVSAASVAVPAGPRADTSPAPLAGPTLESVHLVPEFPLGSPSEQVGAAEDAESDGAAFGAYPSEADGAEGAASPSIPQRLAAGVGHALSGVARGIRLGLDRVLPEPDPESGPRVPAMLAAALAILVPVTVVFIVVALRLSQFDLTHFEQQVLEVEAAAQQAETISLDDVEQARTAWLAVIQRVDLVETSAGRTNDPALMRVRARAQEILDRFDRVTRVQPVPLRTFSRDAQLASPVIRGGADVYTLDRAQSAVYRDTLNPNTAALMTRNAQPVIQRGQAVSAFSVRELIDMVWMSEGGVQRANVLAALDTQGILVTYSPTFAPATAQRLPGADLWAEPVAMFGWRGRLYLLDPAANQIWRYIPFGNSYPNPPEEYFPLTTQRDLSGAVDLGIDTAGNVYILFADGSIKKYNGAVEQPFAYTGMPADGGIRSGRVLFVDAEAALTAMYIVDPEDEAIFQVTLSGAFRYRFRAAAPFQFDDLSGLYVDGDRMYITAGSVLYLLSLSEAMASPAP